MASIRTLSHELQWYSYPYTIRKSLMLIILQAQNDINFHGFQIVPCTLPVFMKVNTIFFLNLNWNLRFIICSWTTQPFRIIWCSENSLKYTSGIWKPFALFKMHVVRVLNAGDDVEETFLDVVNGNLLYTYTEIFKSPGQ